MCVTECVDTCPINHDTGATHFQKVQVVLLDPKRNVQPEPRCWKSVPDVVLVIQTTSSSTCGRPFKFQCEGPNTRLKPSISSKPRFS